MARFVQVLCFSISKSIYFQRCKWSFTHFYITVDYEANDISGFNAVVSKNGLSIHGLAQPVLVATNPATIATGPRATSFYQRSPLNNNLFFAYGNLLQQQQQLQHQQQLAHQRTPASTIEYIGNANHHQFMPYNSISYGFNGNGALF